MDFQREEKEEIPPPTEINFASENVLVPSSAFEPGTLLVCSRYQGLAITESSHWGAEQHKMQRCVHMQVWQSCPPERHQPIATASLTNTKTFPQVMW